MNSPSIMRVSDQARELRDTMSHGPRTALVIDDDEFICGAISAQLTNLGVSQVVTSAGDAETVRLLNEEGPFDLIITDLAMPKFDGFQLTRLISARQPNAAVLYISAAGPKLLSAAKVLAAGRGLQVLGSLKKPIGMADLRRVLINYRAPVHQAIVAGAASAGSPATAKSREAAVSEMLPLIRILDRLRPIQVLQKKLAEVRAQALEIGVSPALTEAADQLGETVYQYCFQLEAERSGAVRLFDQMTFGLDEMSVYLLDEAQSRHAEQNESQQLNNRLLGEVTNLDADMRGATDMTRLQENVRRRLHGIVESLQESKIHEEARLKEFETRTAQMKARIDRLEEKARLLQESVEREQQAASIDRLTGIANRLAYDRRIREEHLMWQKNGQRLMLAVWDIDRFKSVNDAYGHAAGDKALQAISQELSRQLRESDFMARYGGEEFVMILRGLDEEQAVSRLNMLRQSVEKIGFYCNGNPVTLTVSCGVTAFCPGDTAESAFERADAALYQAKNAGRNRCVANFRPESDPNH